MKKITDIGIIIAALIVGAATMFSSDKEITGWLFVFAGIICFIKYIKLEEPNTPPDPPTTP